MSRCLLWILLVLVLAVGCAKQDDDPRTKGAAPDATGSMLPASPRGPGPMAEADTNSVVIADSADPNSTLQQLTQALRDYVVRTRTVPKNFEEFVTRARVQFPPPPDGKKYALEGQAVVLVKK